MLLQQFLTVEIELSFTELPETSPHWGAVFPSTYHGTRTFGDMLFQFDWGRVASQPFQIITSTEITSHETSRKSETVQQRNPGKLHFGVSAALSIVNIFFPSEVVQELFWGRLKGHCLLLFGNLCCSDYLIQNLGEKKVWTFEATGLD